MEYNRSGRARIAIGSALTHVYCGLQQERPYQLLQGNKVVLTMLPAGPARLANSARSSSGGDSAPLIGWLHRKQPRKSRIRSHPQDRNVQSGTGGACRPNRFSAMGRPPLAQPIAISRS